MKADWDDAPLRVRKKKSHLPLIATLAIVTGVGAVVLYSGSRQQAPEVETTSEQLAAREAAKYQREAVAEATPIDDYDEQVNRLLRESAAREAAANTGSEPSTTPTRQRNVSQQIGDWVGSVTTWGLCEAYKDSTTPLGETLRRQNCKPAPSAEITPSRGQQHSQTSQQTEFNDSNYTPRTDVNIARLNAKPFGSGVQSQPEQETRQRPYVNVVEETKRSCWMAPEGSATCRRIKRNAQQYDRRACDLNGDRAACERANRF